MEKRLRHHRGTSSTAIPTTTPVHHQPTLADSSSVLATPLANPAGSQPTNIQLATAIHRPAPPTSHGTLLGKRSCSGEDDERQPRKRHLQTETEDDPPAGMTGASPDNIALAGEVASLVDVLDGRISQYQGNIPAVILNSLDKLFQNVYLSRPGDGYHSRPAEPPRPSMDRTLHTQPALARYPLDNPEDILGGIRPFRPRNSVKSVYVSGWSDEEICKVVKQEEGAGLFGPARERLRYYIDEDDRNHIAVIIDLDGPDGVVIIKGEFEEWILVGQENRSGVYLFFGKGWIFGKPVPDVRFIHQR